MNFSINRMVLLDNLSKAAKVIDPKNVNPSLAGIYLNVLSDQVNIIATSGILSFKSILNNQNSDLEVKQEGKVLLKPKFVLEMLRRLDDEFVVFSMVEDNELIIKTDNSDFSIGVLNSEDYPLIGFREKGIEFNLNPKEVKKTIYQVFVSMNENNKKLILTGLNLKLNNNKAIFSTTDSFRISQKILEIQSDNNEDIDITIPFKTALELPKLLDNAENLKIIIVEGYITFIIDNVIFQSNLIDGRFPNVQIAFPTKFETIITVKQKSILKVLSRFDLVADDGLPAIVNIKVNEDKIEFKSFISEVGKYEEDFDDFVIEGNKSLSISFNTRFLIDAIKTLDEDRIELKLINSTKPIVINNVYDEHLKQVILPTFLSN
ncbi:DNA polymerase III, beta subunit [synthetic Mycoplasma mycoides JCVI-syn1.0]|uniref:Beta sliding clamp n=2 Tax=Mycoplasma mycoides subsp. capri TaxID=40477 RepID=F4MNP8_MYCML|nr:DNA polymerase III subunit beta [Mycoplasma mycoides]ADH22028.1 DNA polymerase III, beta subunit [synthetic Mycoplasma mycoides JCVI-syn1.0]AMW76286.1 DNA polymerase III, beta subunit: sliding clamp [synthetic bacterium JCVI-Syn3.0]AMW76724.1 DNA polymerase III, beta subunit: sliding clamp [synthetic bacterium JCVI-Syn2.0]AVX54570.1 DNA polymerase III subunit beta [synthetic bacterium JCVI-Syn3A]QWN46260.1 DNA polymerase III subunit beta [synthetic bacterium JCVI-Syn3B]